jgi:WG repeat protein
MKMSIALMLVLVGAGSALAADALFPIRVDGKWGYIDATGAVVIKPTIDRPGACVRSVFAVDLAPVVISGKWVYIDKTGAVKVRVPGNASVSRGGFMKRGDGREQLAAPSIQNCGPFVDGLARVTVGAIRMGDIGRLTTGFIGPDGKWVIRPQYSAARNFSDGLAAVRMRPRWAYVDKTGKVIVKECGYAFDFKQGRALVRLDGAAGGAWGLIDKTGKMLAKFPKVERVRQFSEGLAAFMQDRKWGFIDATGKVVVKAQFTIAEDFRDGMAAVWIGSFSRRPGNPGPKCRFIDKAGRFITGKVFESAYSARDGLAPVQLGGKWGYLNAKGVLVVKPQYDSAAQFSDGLAAVMSGGSVVYIDTKGKVAVKPQVKVTFGQPFVHGVARVRFEGHHGYMDRQGKIIYKWKT